MQSIPQCKHQSVYIVSLHIYAPIKENQIDLEKLVATNDLKRSHAPKSIKSNEQRNGIMFKGTIY